MNLDSKTKFLRIHFPFGPFCTCFSSSIVRNLTPIIITMSLFRITCLFNPPVCNQCHCFLCGCLTPQPVFQHPRPGLSVQRWRGLARVSLTPVQVPFSQCSDTPHITPPAYKPFLCLCRLRLLLLTVTPFVLLTGLGTLIPTLGLHSCVDALITPLRLRPSAGMASSVCWALKLHPGCHSTPCGHPLSQLELWCPEFSGCSLHSLWAVTSHWATTI